MRLCDICKSREADHIERVVENGASMEFAYCRACYERAIALGLNPVDVAREKSAREGLECPSCGCTAEDFERDYRFGCPDCYRNMKGIAGAELMRLRRGEDGFAVAFEPLTNEERGKVCDYVVSSRIRLARNVEGLPFPRRFEELFHRRALSDEETGRFVSLRNGALRAAEGVFDGDIYDMGELDALKKAMLLERHLISLPLAKSELGAVIIEKGNSPEISVMLGEEDHIRAQCVKSGLDLAGAYARLKKYDLNLKHFLPVAFDREWGYIAACPTNVGTGMRASVMMFLPALKSLGEIDGAFESLRRRFGITVRGYFGEGSEAAYDMYQMSNAGALAISEEGCVRMVESAAMELAAMEGAATRELLRTCETKLVDRIQRSYGTLLHAHSLESDEMFDLLADVRLGVRIGLFDIKLAQLDAILDDLASAFEILCEGLDAERRGIKRARIVRERLGAV